MVVELGLKNENYNNLSLLCLFFPTEVCSLVSMVVNVTTESCATAVGLMQLDQDARQVCEETNLTGFLGLYLGSHSYKNGYPLPEGFFLHYCLSFSFL